MDPGVELRAGMHAALGEASRLRIVDHLLLGDASPGELGLLVDLPTNLLAHHLNVLSQAGLIRGCAPRATGGAATSSWSTTTLRWPRHRRLPAAMPVPPARVVFVCTHNSARSQLAAAAVERQASTVPATSAGTHPARAGASPRGRGRTPARPAPRTRQHGARPGRAQRRRPGRRRLRPRARGARRVQPGDATCTGRCPTRPAPDTDAAFDAAYDRDRRRVDRLAATPHLPRPHRATETTAMTTDLTSHLDQQLALRTAATRLAADFDGVFGAETIERFLRSSLRPVRRHRAPSPASCRCWPSGSPGSGCTPWRRWRACTTTAGRPCCSSASTTPAAPRWRSASSPASPVTVPSPGPVAPNPASRSTRRRRGDGENAGSTSPREFPKPWTDEVVRAADVVITMGCGDACPVFPGKRYEDWDARRPGRPGRRRRPPDPRRDRAPRPRPAGQPERTRRGLSHDHDVASSRPESVPIPYRSVMAASAVRPQRRPRVPSYATCDGDDVCC